MVNSVVSKVTNRLKFLYRYSKYLNSCLRRNLCSALLQCHLDYCCTAWFTGISAKSRKKLQIVQNKIIRFILSLPNRAHIDQNSRNSVNFLSIKDRACQLRLNHVHSIFYNTSPYYLKEHFTRSVHIHSHRTRSSSYGFLVPRVKGIASNTFFYNAICDWNGLPPSIQIISSKAAFKIAVKKHLSERGEGQLCMCVVLFPLQFPSVAASLCHHFFCFVLGPHWK